MNWRVIESGTLSPQEIMDKDGRLLAELDPAGPSLLHFYEWNAPCLTYGYFTDPSRYLHVDALLQSGLQMARRPTGGGVIFHLTDWAFSVFIPAYHPRLSDNTLENYGWINQQVAEAIACFAPRSSLPELLKGDSHCIGKDCNAFCMANPTHYDLMMKGKKAGGAAQRRTKRGLLHQGSLSLLFPPDDLLLKMLKEGEQVAQAMREHSHCLLPEGTTWEELAEARSALKKILSAEFAGISPKFA